MESITLNVTAGQGGDYTVELYRWSEGAQEEQPAASATVSGTVFAPGGELDLAARQRFFLETGGQDAGFRKLGQDLWKVLHAGAVAAEWDAAVQRVEDALFAWEAQPASEKAASEPPALRTYLQIDESLTALPWELLRSTHDLFLIAGMPVLRAEKRKFLPRGDAAVWPIRSLVVVGASAAEVGALKADEELEGIRDVFRESEHLFDLKIIETRLSETFTPADLKTELQNFRPHIFHFIGHGRTDENNPRLEICDRNTKRDWTSDQIELDVRSMGGVLRLAFLNACRTGEPKKSDCFSIAQAFFRGRALSVLSMQADVSGQAARTCTRRFYSEVVNGKPVDAALAAARDMVRAEMGSDTRHAFVPVLSVNTAPEHILACPPRAPVKAAGLDEVRKYFVDRIDERRVVIHSMARSEILKRHCSAVLLRGQEEKVGKTWLQMWLLHALAQRNHAIYTVEAFDRADWLQFVLALCEGAPESDSFSQPLPAETRKRFYEDVARLAGKQPPAEGARPDFKLEDFGARNDAHEKVLAAFHLALRDQAEQTPGRDIVLAVRRISNPLQSLSAAHVKTLKDHLWDKIAADPAGRVKVIVELPYDPRGDYGFEFAEDLWQTVDLAKFSAAVAPEALMEYFYRRNPGRQLSPELIDQIRRVKREVRPDQLERLVEFLELIP